ncbi:MAG TPA: acyl-CoA dehydratase activase [Candidatus Limnocylindrales bacterium]|nr:acyl-CoA dehydratase activase [Candidatus Limnocylindrales bacterium]
MITAGMDLGAQTVKAVILKDNVVLSRARCFSGFDPAQAANQALDDALKMANLKLPDIHYSVATGSNMELAPQAHSTVSMLNADAKAGTHLFPKARTVIDVGAEEARAVKIDDKGAMLDFVVNERCAAGAGTFIEAMARALEVNLEEMGQLSLKAERASSINASCVIFGESDVVSLIHQQESKAEIARAIFDALAERVASMIHVLGVNLDIVLVGGLAKDVGFVTSLSRKLSVKLLVPDYPDFAGALGAALIASSRARSLQK